MLFISHRGNLLGPDPSRENMPRYIEEAILLDFDVEVDIWYHDDRWFLGHDNPTYLTNEDFIIHNSHVLWLHCKNIDAVCKLIDLQNFQTNVDINFFYHQTDDVVLTSLGHIWTFPEQKITRWSIAVNPETWKKKGFDITKTNAMGVCSDFIARYKNRLEIHYAEK